MYSQDLFGKQPKAAPKTAAQRAALAAEALQRATTSESPRNDAICIAHFTNLGYKDVRPRENVLTFWAWKALGRSVKKGEHGLKLMTVIEEKDPTTNQANGAKHRATAVVFHIDQTEAK